MIPQQMSLIIKLWLMDWLPNTVSSSTNEHWKDENACASKYVSYNVRFYIIFHILRVCVNLITK